MPPRPTLEPGDLVTPTGFARAAGIDPNNVRVWIHRSAQIIGREVKPLGRLGTYSRYDWNDLADLDREMRRRARLRSEARAA